MASPTGTAPPVPHTSARRVEPDHVDQSVLHGHRRVSTFVTVYPDAATPTTPPSPPPTPLTSNLNVSNGLAVPNFDVVKIGADGMINLFNDAGSINLLADIAGYES